MSQPIQRILIATDFSETAGMAAQRAARLAERHAAELLMVHALESGSWIEQLASMGGGSVHRRDVFEASLTGLEQERARIGLPVNCRTELLESPLHQALPDVLATYPADLLVMGSHGAGGWGDALLGSTADRVLRLHRLPVLLVRNQDRRDYERVAFATDFSPASETAARFGLVLTQGAIHLLLHACEPPFESTLAFAGVSDEVVEHYRRDAARQALADLEAFAERIGGDAVRAVPALREGRPSRVLTGFVTDAEIDLLVVGVSGRSRIERGLLGSVSRHAASGLPCDVLLVPDSA